MQSSAANATANAKGEKHTALLLALLPAQREDYLGKLRMISAYYEWIDEAKEEAADILNANTKPKKWWCSPTDEELLQKDASLRHDADVAEPSRADDIALALRAEASVRALQMPPMSTVDADNANNRRSIDLTVDDGNIHLTVDNPGASRDEGASGASRTVDLAAVDTEWPSTEYRIYCKPDRATKSKQRTELRVVTGVPLP